MKGTEGMEGETSERSATSLEATRESVSHGGTESTEGEHRLAQTDTDGHGQEKVAPLGRMFEGRRFAFKQAFRDNGVVAYRVTSRKDGSVAWEVFRVEVVDGRECYALHPAWFKTREGAMLKALELSREGAV